MALETDQVPPTASHRDDLLDAEEIGAELRVNPKTVRRWMADGELPYRKLGRRNLVRRSELEQFIDDRTHQA